MRLALLATVVLAGQVSTSFVELPDRSDIIHLEYDAESLTSSVSWNLGFGQLNFDIANLFELPELDPPGGFYLDENSLLSEELIGFEVDTGNERFFSLTFSLNW